MRILQFITELTPAGAERVVCELSKELVQAGHKVVVASLMPFPENEAILNELRSSQIEVVSLNVSKLTSWRVVGIRRIINKFKPDVVHSHLIHPNIIARLAKIASSIQFKLINTVHIAERRSGKKLLFLLDRVTFPLCDAQTAVSKEAALSHSKKTKIHPDKIRVIINGISNYGDFSPEEKADIIANYKLQDCKYILCTVGRFRHQKGYDLLLGQLKHSSSFIPKGETWGLVMIGEGPEYNNIKKMIEKVPDNIKVITAGFKHDAPKYFSIFDVFIMPSRYEGYPLTLLEAMSYGIPILASTAPTIIEASSGYRNIRYIDFNNPSEFSSQLKTVIGFKERAPVHKNTVTEMVNQYLELY